MKTDAGKDRLVPIHPRIRDLVKHRYQEAINLGSDYLINWGFGSCAAVCPENAISIVNGIAHIDEEACVGCGKCAETCPKALIDLVPENKKTRVQCSSKEFGKNVMSVCKAGCIGCKACEKVCKLGAIKVENNIAQIDYDKCVGCGLCAGKCPKGIITGKKLVPKKPAPKKPVEKKEA